jgi:hypothetical protein
MIERCEDPTNPAFAGYGGRGISVCQRWRSSFAAFETDMGPRPTPQHQIDRADNDGNYEPGNCRWVTVAEQQRNRRQTRWFTIDGKRLCLKDWAREFGLRYEGLRYRVVKRGMGLSEAANDMRRRAS